MHFALFFGCILERGQLMSPLSFRVLGDQCEMLLKFIQIYHNVLVHMNDVKKGVPEWDRTTPFSNSKSEIIMHMG